MRPLTAPVLLFHLAAASAASAQCRPGGAPNPPAVPRAIVGLVMDSLNAPVADAEAFIRQPRRMVRTSANGRFRLDSLAPGSYELIVRRIGYEIQIQTIFVTDSGGVARYCLVSQPAGLAPIVTSAPRLGLTGVVSDTAYAIVPGAHVRVAGEGLWMLSDSAGRFAFPLSKGTYALVVKKDGYGQQLASVTIPPDSGRHIVIWLGSRPRNANRMAEAMEGIRERIMMTPAHRYHMLTAEDLARNELSLTQAVRVAGRAAVSDDCEALIAGEGFTLPLYMFDKRDIALIEILNTPMRRRGPTSINGNADIPLQGRGSASGSAISCQVQVIVWMK